MSNAFVIPGAPQGLLDRINARRARIPAGMTMTAGIVEPNQNDDSNPITPPAGDDTGFPANTPVADMTIEQQAAYWKHQSRRHENRYKALGDVDKLKADAADAAQLRAANMNDTEKAIAEAEERGRQAARTELQPQLVAAAFRATAGDRITDEQMTTLLAGINPAAFLDDAGAVATDKVAAHLAVATTAPDPNAGLRNIGGRREFIRQSGRDAGLAEAEKRFGKKTA